MVGVSPALGAGVVTVGHAASLRYQGAGGAGGGGGAGLLPLPCAQDSRGIARLTCEACRDGGYELWVTEDAFKLSPEITEEYSDNTSNQSP